MTSAKRDNEPEELIEGDDPTLDALLTHIGSRLFELRQVQRLSCAALEDFTDIVASEIKVIETGRRNITIKTADRLAHAVGVHTHELLLPKELSRVPKRGTKLDAAKWDASTLEALLAHIGSRIREMREMQALSLPALEEFTGITQRELRRIEAGERNITIKTADRIARAVGVHTYELFIPRERSSIRAKRPAKKAKPDA